MDSLSPVNGHSTSPDALESSLSTLRSIGSTGYVDVEWSVLKQTIKSRLHQNVQLYLASSTQPSAQLEPSPFPRSSPVVPFPEEEGDKHDSNMSSADATTDLADLSKKPNEYQEAAEKNGIAEKGLNDVSLSERIGPIDVIGGRTLPGKVNREEAEFMESRVSRLLDDFEFDPPFTIQRLCEILVDPQSIHSSLGKHIRAIERTLLVTSPFRPPSPSDNNTIPTFSTKPNPSNVPGLPISPRNSSAPLFSPIPFLALQTPPPKPTDHTPSSAGSDEPNEIIITRPMSPLNLEPKSDQEMPESERSGDQPSVESAPPSIPLNITSGPTSLSSSGVIEPDELRVDELDAGVIPDSLPLVSPSLSTSPSKAVPTSTSEVPTSTSVLSPVLASDVASDKKSDQVSPKEDVQSTGSTLNHRHFLANKPVALSSTTSIPDHATSTGSTSNSALGSLSREDSVRERPVGDDDGEQAEDAKKTKLGEEARVSKAEESVKEEDTDKEERFERSTSPAVDPLRIKLTEGEEVKRV